MASQRMERVQKLLRSEISSVLQRRLKDPRVGMVTVTEVEASPNLRHARVFVSLVKPEESESEALAGLKSAAGFIRRELMQVLHLRPMPVLEFEIDTALARGARTLDLLDQIRHEREDDGPRAGPGDPSPSEQ
ncbi:MAG TPA: 30S ribosome-binding factor RbfA [Armatimonadota bacterium]|nr:30S ribosome-binding factor RbfA [Armatimonadota bacterium]